MIHPVTSLTLLRMMVHLDQKTSTANICETLVTKYEFPQNFRKGQVFWYTNETKILKLIQRKYLRTFMENKILLLEVLS
jgi:hypothetical protein